MAYFSKIFERQMKIWKILIEDRFDPQPDSSIQPMARGLLHMEREFIAHHIKDNTLGLEHLTASKQSKDVFGKSLEVLDERF